MEEDDTIMEDVLMMMRTGEISQVCGKLIPCSEHAWRQHQIAQKQ